MANQRKYGKLDNPTDVRNINKEIRDEVEKSKSKRKLLRLRRQSFYLYTLTFSPKVKESLWGKVRDTRRVAKLEYIKTKAMINKRLDAMKRK